MEKNFHHNVGFSTPPPPRAGCMLLGSVLTETIYGMEGRLLSCFMRIVERGRQTIENKIARSGNTKAWVSPQRAAFALAFPLLLAAFLAAGGAAATPPGARGAPSVEDDADARVNADSTL